MTYEKYSEACKQIQLSNLQDKTVSETIATVSSQQAQNAMATLKTWAKVSKSSLLKYRINCLFKPTKENQKADVKLKCKCGFYVSDSHLQSCNKLRGFFENFTAPLSLKDIDLLLSQPVQSLDPETLNTISEAINRAQVETCKTFEVKAGQVKIDRFLERSITANVQKDSPDAVKSSSDAA